MKLEEDGIAVVALSNDTVADAQSHRERDELPFALLADPELDVLKAYGVEHQKSLKMHTFDVLGLPLGYPAGFRSMAIPTTILVDEEGVVRWIDQADDYRIRGNEARVRRAIDTVWGSGPRS